MNKQFLFIKILSPLLLIIIKRLQVRELDIRLSSPIEGGCLLVLDLQVAGVKGYYLGLSDLPGWGLGLRLMPEYSLVLDLVLMPSSVVVK